MGRPNPSAIKDQAAICAVRQEGMAISPRSALSPSERRWRQSLEALVRATADFTPLAIRTVRKPASLSANLLLAVGVAALMSGCGEGKQERTWTRLPSERAVLRQEAEDVVGGGVAKATPAGAEMPREAMRAAGAPMGAGMPAPADRSRVVATTGTLVASGIGFMIPQGWQPETPSTPMRLAQYRLPGPGGDAELTVFAFGPGQGGSPKANIERWVAQFQADESTTATQPAEVAELETGGLRIYLVKTSGTYTPTTMGMMGPPADPRPNYALFGVVVEGGPEGLLFVKVTGPKATLEEQNARLEDFVRSVKKL